MRNNKRFQAGLVVSLAVCIGLFSAWPFLQFPGLPADNDAELHIYRIAEVGYSLRAGRLYPRWAPDFYHGYGYPIFNYYAPLTYHLGSWLTLLQPAQAEAGAKLVFVLALVVGAVGAYYLGALFGDKGGGLLGALVFSFAPYIQLINPHIRGDLPETLALAGLPWALWAWERLWRTSTYHHAGVIITVLTTSLVFISHNLTGLTLVVLIAGLSLWRLGATLTASRSSEITGKGAGAPRLLTSWKLHRGRWINVTTAAAGFVLLTAFFWLPFLAERGAIQLDVAGEGHYDFRNHFVTLQELVAPLPPIDHRATTTAAPMSAGAYGLLLACAGFLGASRKEKKELSIYALLALALLWLVTRSSRVLWAWIPGLAFYQFPWRFLGPLAALFIPLVASMGNLPQRILQGQRRGLTQVLVSAAPTIAGAAILLGAMPGLYPQPWTSGFEAITQRAIIQAELRGRWRGTTSTNDFVPTTVDMIPGPEERVLESYTSPPVDRVNRYTLPENTEVRVMPDDPWVNRFDVTTERAFTLRLYLFDFPGWRAYIDGEPTEIKIARPEGFITIDVPEGRHEVVVRFESTLPRTLGGALSGVGLLSLVLPAFWKARRRESHPSVKRSANATTGPRPGKHQAHFDPSLLGVAGVGGIFVIIVVFKVVLFDPGGWFRYRSPLGEAQAAERAQKAELGYPEREGELTLLGYDLSRQRLRPGDVLEVTLYWQAQRPLTKTYQSFVHLVYPEGEIWAQSDHLNPAGFPTNLWPTDRYVRDKHQLTLPEGAPSGPYLVSVGLYTLTDAQRLPVQAAECGQRPDHIVLCQPITVRRK
jgi:hypothetical protein